MNKNVALDALAYFCFCALAGTGLLLDFRLCENTSGTILGIAAAGWRDIHEWVEYVFIATVMLHLVLHWAWIRKLATGHLWSTVLVQVSHFFRVYFPRPARLLMAVLRVRMWQSCPREWCAGRVSLKG